MPVTCVCGGTSQNWWPIIVGGIEFAIGIGLTIYTFRKTFHQKIDERRGSWYHKVVVDRAIGLLFSYLDAERAACEASALACEIARSSGSLSQTEIDQKYASAVTEFQQRLRPVRDEITNLALIFDKQLFDKVQTTLLTLDDNVSNWFYDAQTVGILRVSPTILVILSDFHRDVLTILRDYEFIELPKVR